MKRVLRGIGHLVLGGAVTLILFGLTLLGIGAYLVSIPYSKLSRRHAQLVVLVSVVEGLAELWRLRAPAGEEPELVDAITDRLRDELDT